MKDIEFKYYNEHIVYKGVKIYSFEVMINNYERLLYMDITDDPILENTVRFMFGENMSHEGVLRGWLYQRRIRIHKENTLQLVYKNCTRRYFNLVLANQDYFKIYSENEKI